MDACKPRYIAAVAQTDVVDGWRDKHRDGTFESVCF